MLARFRRECERIQQLLIGEILSFDDAQLRAECVMALLCVAEELLDHGSHHALMIVLSSLESQSIYRLRQTWALVNRVMPGRLEALAKRVGTGGAHLVSADIIRFLSEGATEDMRNSLRLMNVLLMLPPQPLPQPQVQAQHHVEEERKQRCQR